MRPEEAQRLLRSARATDRSRLALALVGIAIWMLRISAVLLLALPLLLLAVWLAE